MTTPSEAVVYTFGKVGSTAVAAALDRAGIAAHDIHSLDPSVLKRQARTALKRDAFPPHHVSLSMVLREEARVSVWPDARLILMRADCPDDVKSATLGRVFGREVTVMRGNVGAEKPYAAAYARAREAIRFPGERLGPVYGSAHVRQFWTQAEIDEMHSRWSAPATRDTPAQPDRRASP